jgi:hypothetical protein
VTSRGPRRGPRLADPARAPAGRPRGGGGDDRLPWTGRATVPGPLGRARPSRRTGACSAGCGRRPTRSSAGTATLAAERYASLLDPDQRDARRPRGARRHPVVGTVARSGAVPWDVPVFAEAGVPCQVYSGPAGGGAAAAVETELEVLPGPDLLAVLEHLGRRRGVRPSRARAARSSCARSSPGTPVDDLLLTVAPLLVAGRRAGLARGEELSPPRRMALQAPAPGRRPPVPALRASARVSGLRLRDRVLAAAAGTAAAHGRRQREPGLVLRRVRRDTLGRSWTTRWRSWPTARTSSTSAGESGVTYTDVTPAEVECGRVVPLVERLVAEGVTVSVDTWKPEVADAALGAGPTCSTTSRGWRTRAWDRPPPGRAPASCSCTPARRPSRSTSPTTAAR